MPADMDAPGSDVSERLTARDRQVLKEIIHSFVVHGKPVSSRSVSRHGELDLSAASIRNVMSDLEEYGLLTQPHTSAGRVPTQAGYRLYVENLMDRERLSLEERRYIEDHFDDVDGDELIDVASELLSELSNQVGVVLTPSVGDTTLRSLDLVPVGEQRIMCVIVSSAGFVDTVSIQTDEDLPRDELVRIANYVTDQFAGLSLNEIRNRLVQLMAEERARVDRLLANAIDVARRAVDQAHNPEVVVRGTRALLDLPELADVERVRQMLDTFTDTARLVGLLNLCLSSDGVRVFIGPETNLTSALDFSLVAAPYGIDARPMGSLGIIGPSRMEYPRAIALVHFLGQALSRALAAYSRS
ncbi:MAG: heat-inducible transcriptional repressor HrcA [Acidobacteriota bacterium]